MLRQVKIFTASDADELEELEDRITDWLIESAAAKNIHETMSAGPNGSLVVAVWYDLEEEMRWELIEALDPGLSQPGGG